MEEPTKSDTTTIKVKKTTRDRLEELATRAKSFDKVIVELLDKYNHNKKKKKGE